MSKPHRIIEDFAQKQLRVYEETQAKLDAARVMLAALEKALAFFGPSVSGKGSTVAAMQSAIAQAEAAGIKVEG